MKKAARRLAIWVVAPIATLVVAVFALTLVIRYPNPVAALQLAQSVPSVQPQLMPQHQIPRSGPEFQWPEAATQEKLPESITFEGRDYLTDDLLRATATNALIVIRNGVITYEDYADGFAPEQLVNTMSIGKTMVGMSIGILVSQGLVREQASITEYLPQFADVQDLNLVTIKHLLDMQSCIGIDEDYPSGPVGWGFPVAQMFATTDIDFVLDNNLKVVCAPGSEEYEYRSANTQLLGMVVTEVTGTSLSEFFATNVYSKLGAANDASWSVDRVGGYEKSYCCFNITARDLGLIGGVFLNGGKVAFGDSAGTQVISEDWYSRMTTPAKQWFGGYGSERFGANMWHRSSGNLLTQGYRGQFMLMNPETNTIVIKLSDDVENRYYDESLALLELLSE